MYESDLGNDLRSLVDCLTECADIADRLEFRRASKGERQYFLNTADQLVQMAEALRGKLS